MVGEVHFAQLVHILEVVGHHLEGVAQVGHVPHEHAPDLEGLEQPLVRVEGERVGQRDASHLRTKFRRKRGRGAVGTIDVKPRLVRVA